MTSIEKQSEDLQSQIQWRISGDSSRAAGPNPAEPEERCLPKRHQEKSQRLHGCSAEEWEGVRDDERKN